METKKEINRLLQRLIDETITPQELHKFYTYVKRSKKDPEILKILTDSWNQLSPRASHYESHSNQEGNGIMLRIKQRFLEELMKGNSQLYSEIAAIINKKIKGHDN